MSKENDKKFVEIEDPLAGLGFNEIEDTDDTDEIDSLVVENDDIDESDENDADLSEYIQPSEKSSSDFASVLASVKDFFRKASDKTSEVLEPVKKVSETKMPAKLSMIILGSVAAAAIILSVLIFALYSGAAYSSGRSVEEWAEEWNSVSFSDSCTYTFNNYYTMPAYMDTLMLSDTDHVYLTPEDIKALKKGKTITLFDDLAELSVETYKGDFKMAHMQIDYDNLCNYYFGRNYAFDSYRYSPGLIDDSTFRVLASCAMMVSPFNDNINTQNEILTQILYLYINDGPAYNYGGGNRIDAGDYSYSIYYTYEDNLVVSGSDVISATDTASASDISSSDIQPYVESHLIVHITCEYNKAGQKKHAADWSWWNELFPGKEETESVIPDTLTDPEYNSELSASDASVFSETDISASDIQ